MKKSLGPGGLPSFARDAQFEVPKDAPKRAAWDFYVIFPLSKWHVLRCFFPNLGKDMFKPQRLDTPTGGAGTSGASFFFKFTFSKKTQGDTYILNGFEQNSTDFLAKKNCSFIRGFMNIR